MKFLPWSTIFWWLLQWEFQNSPNSKFPGERVFLSKYAQLLILFSIPTSSPQKSSKFRLIDDVLFMCLLVQVHSLIEMNEANRRLLKYGWMIWLVGELEESVWRCLGMLLISSSPSSFILSLIYRTNLDVKYVRLKCVKLWWVCENWLRLWGKSWMRKCDLLVIRVIESGMREVWSFLGEILWDAWCMYEHDYGIWFLL